MSGKVIAVYNMKGGVGKTTLSVNLAWAAASLSARRTLLWDLDGQAAASWILRARQGRAEAAAAIAKDIDPEKLVQATTIDRLELLPADASLHGLDVAFHALDKKKRLAKLADDLARRRDRVIIDCPPGLSATADQILRAADLVVVPVIPSALAQRALAEVTAHLRGAKGVNAAVMPLFAMADRRRALHRAAISAAPDWPVVPMNSLYERMADARAPAGTMASLNHPANRAIAKVWQAVEAALARG